MTKRLLPALAATAVVSAAVAACGGGEAETPAAPGGGGNAAVSVEAFDLGFEPARVSTAAGEVTIAMRNVGKVAHTLVVEGHEDDMVLRTGPGTSDRGAIQLPPGTYVFYCDVPGHRQAGMEGTLEVSG